MTDGAKQAETAKAAALLVHYSFERTHDGVEELMAQWLQQYPPQWLRWAVIEALYQGRYKVISVSQILATWKRRGQPLYHFNHEFERLVCGQFNQISEDTATPETPLGENCGDDGEMASKPTPATDAGADTGSLDDLGWRGSLSTAQEILALLRRSAAATSARETAITATATVGENGASEGLNPQVPQELPDPWLDNHLTPVSETIPEEEVLAELESSGETFGKDGQPGSIHQFIPKPESSDVYAKLKAVLDSGSGE
ncbi:hypothetical protein [[Phormidium] sp. ETS-05]|uniref:hypothetical protein n=1 Tax=[Phormidium] sp. ETS-05 TaxID=222819 RepID=UPI0018EF35D6|nr:hypothetical protein [[Phormidium] sp. ETS-05]